MPRAFPLAALKEHKELTVDQGQDKRGEGEGGKSQRRGVGEFTVVDREGGLSAVEGMLLGGEMSCPVSTVGQYE